MSQCFTPESREKKTSCVLYSDQSLFKWEFSNLRLHLLILGNFSLSIGALSWKIAHSTHSQCSRVFFLLCFSLLLLTNFSLPSSLLLIASLFPLSICRPGSCAGTSSMERYKVSNEFPDDTLNFIKMHPLMDEAVPSIAYRPWFLKTMVR